MNERIVNLPGAFIPMAEARGLQAQSLVKMAQRICKAVILCAAEINKTCSGQIRRRW